MVSPGNPKPCSFALLLKPQTVAIFTEGFETLNYTLSTETLNGTAVSGVEAAPTVIQELFLPIFVKSLASIINNKTW